MHPGLVFLGGSFLALIFKNKIRYIVSLLVALVTLISCLQLVPGEIWEISFMDYTLQPLRVDPAARTLGLVFSFCGLLALIYAGKRNSIKFYFLTHLYGGSALMVTLAGDLFTLYVFWELMTISSFFLIINSDYIQSLKNGFYYFIIHLAGGLSLLWGIFLHFSQTGSLQITHLETGLPFILAGIAIKLGFIGFHFWLPRTYSRVPFYISVVLSLFTTKIGIYGLFRLVPPHDLIIYAGGITALGAVILALRENNLRNILVYSISSQLGYVIAGLGAGNELGLAGGLGHLINHIFYKTALFMLVGIIIYTTKKENLTELGGLAKKMPRTILLAIIPVLAITGLPLTSGYLSKTIIKYAVPSGAYWLLYITGIGTTLVYLKLIYYSFWGQKKTALKQKPGWPLLLPLAVLNLLILITGFSPQPVLSLLDYQPELNYFSSLNLWQGSQPLLWGLLLFIVIHKSKKIKFFLLQPTESPQDPEFDFYLLLKKPFYKLSNFFSSLHTGNLARYILWSLATLLFLWIILLV